MTAPLAVEATLRANRARRPLLVPYVTGGLDTKDCRWLDLLAALVDAGADAVEVGIPFSDPVMDGPTIQEASQQALETGATPSSILAQLAGFEAGVPLVAMTYANLVYAAGWDRFAGDLRRAGVSGAILPDLPLEELGPWEQAAAEAGVESVLLAAPVTPDDRLDRLCQRTRGFLYAVAAMGVTGERTALSASARVLAERVRARSDIPVLVGFGVSTPEHAVEIAGFADGAVVASAIIRRVLDGADAHEAAEVVGDMRAALDALPAPA